MPRLFWLPTLAMRFPRISALLIVIYGICFSTGGYWIGQRLRFAGVEDWPCAEARIIGGGTVAIPYQRESRYGHEHGKVHVSHVTFTYTVDGRGYQSDLATPDGGGLPGNPFEEPWKAYYKPGSPEVAVLRPVSYQGTGWLLTSLVTAVLVGIHLCVAMPGWLARRGGR